MEDMSKSGNKFSEFKKIDWLLFWFGVVLLAVGIPNLLDVLLTALVGGAELKIYTDLAIALLYLIIGGWLFVSKKRKLKKVAVERTYKKTMKIAYIAMGLYFLILIASVIILYM